VLVSPLSQAPHLVWPCTFTLDSGASRCFFRDSTTVTLLSAPVAVSLADPSGGPVLARSSMVLPCPADEWVDTFTPGGQRVAISCGPLLVSRPVTPHAPLAPPPWSPLGGTPPWHALPLPCLWSSQVSASPPTLACPSTLKQDTQLPAGVSRLTEFTATTAAATAARGVALHAARLCVAER
ncbi:unnamed protein product, partial [Closterium sp. NIES-54]